MIQDIDAMWLSLHNSGLQVTLRYGATTNPTRIRVTKCVAHLSKVTTSTKCQIFSATKDSEDLFVKLVSTSFTLY